MKSKTLSLLIASISGLLVFAVLYAGYVMNLTSGIKDSVLRLHVVANSDSAADQRLKLCVRDRVLSEFSDVFKECNSQGESVVIAKEYREDIAKAAKDELASRGCTESVSVEIGKCWFPTKFYKDISLPRGTYTAVNIKIGKAQGQNWWCVMYPPLCIGKETVSLPDESRLILEQTLSDDEYELIQSEGKMNVKIKFRIAEILGGIF